jgi:16S rRNA (cytosine967-C5)-methyltransferase
VLDVCAAPGGKATLMAGTGAQVTAIDLHFHRARLVRRNAVELGCIDRVGVLVANSAELPVVPASFDRVLLDAPCSGLGSLRRRPDARWRMERSEIEHLVKLQKDLLRAAASAVKPGGTLVYSVCTLTSEETTEIDQYMQSGFPDFDVLPAIEAHGWEPHGRGARILPGDTDGMSAFRYQRRS